MFAISIAVEPIEFSPLVGDIAIDRMEDYASRIRTDFLTGIFGAFYAKGVVAFLFYGIIGCSYPDPSGFSRVPYDED